MVAKTKENTVEIPQDGETAEMENTNAQETTRTNPVTIGPDAGGNSVLAAWRGLVHLFDAQVERFDVTSEGVFAVNLSFDAEYPAEQIVSDLYMRGDKVVERRLDLIPTYFWAQGETPDQFVDASEMTSWMVQYFKGAGEGDGSRSPQYVKDAITAHKKETGIAAPRGRKRKILRLDALDEIKPEVLAGVNDEELERLQVTISRALEMSAQARAASA